MNQFILNNVTYQFFFVQADAKSRWEAAQTLLLPPDGGMEMIRALELSTCIVVEILGPFPCPMLLEIDDVRVPTGPVAYQQMPFVPGRTLAELPALEKALDERIAEHKRAHLRQQAGRSELSAVASDLLSMAVMHPYLPCARLWEKMSRDVSPGQRKAARAELEKGHLATFEEVRLGRVSKLLIEVSDSGYTHLNRPKPKRHGRGGVLHRHAAHWLAWLGSKRGLKSSVEYQIPSNRHHADVAWCSPDGVDVFEFCDACLDNLAEHAKACFCREAPVRSMTVVTAVKSKLAEARQVLVEDDQVRGYLDRIRFAALESLIVELEL